MLLYQVAGIKYPQKKYMLSMYFLLRLFIVYQRNVTTVGIEY